MWIGINKTGISTQIIENGISRVIPFDRKPYEIDNSAWRFHDQFLVLQTPEQTKEKERLAKGREDRAIQAERRKRPLHGKMVKQELREHNSIWMKKRDGTKKNQWNWSFRSPDGELFENVKLTEWCKEKKWCLNTLYRFVKENKKYRGWEIIRTMKEGK